MHMPFSAALVLPFSSFQCAEHRSIFSRQKFLISYDFRSLSMLTCEME